MLNIVIHNANPPAYDYRNDYATRGFRPQPPKLATIAGKTYTLLIINSPTHLAVGAH